MTSRSFHLPGSGITCPSISTSSGIVPCKRCVGFAKDWNGFVVGIQRVLFEIKSGAVQSTSKRASMCVPYQVSLRTELFGYSAKKLTKFAKGTYSENVPRNRTRCPISTSPFCSAVFNCAMFILFGWNSLECLNFLAAS